MEQGLGVFARGGRAECIIDLTAAAPRRQLKYSARKGGAREGQDVFTRGKRAVTRPL